MTAKIAETVKLRCPECRSTRLTRDGRQVSHRKKVQRWLCANCLRRTIYPKPEGGKVWLAPRNV